MSKKVKLHSGAYLLEILATQITHPLLMGHLQI